MEEFADIAAIVLAGGFSKRMGRFKPLLQLGEHRTVERVVRLFQDAGIGRILVIVGHRGEDIQRAVLPLNAVCVENPDYAQGMFTSVLAGVRALPEGCRSFFIHPADIPMVRWQTVRRLAEAGRDQSGVVLHPTFNGHRGHPTLIPASLGPRILEWSGDGGLRSFLKGYESESRELPVADEAVLLDLDTPGDYSRMLARLATEGLPSEAECRVLMEGLQSLPAPIAAHCRTVAEVARRMAVSLHAAGLEIDVELARKAALLHDIARTGEDHARAGARLLEAHGFPRLAPIVAAHMDLAVDAARPLDAVQIVYLADKLVIGDQVVDLEQRFARKMKKYGKDPAIVQAIARRRDTAKWIRDKVERLIGVSLQEIVAKVKAPR